MKDKVKALIAKGEFTAYNVGVLFQALGETLQEANNAVLWRVDYCKEVTESLANKTVEILEIWNKEADDFEAQVDKLIDRMDDAYRKVSIAAKRINENYREMPKMISKYDIGELNAMLDFAMKCQRLDDVQWARVIELARSLGDR